MNEEVDSNDGGFLPALICDGRPLLMPTGFALVLSGAFALFLSATGSFLPQDVAYLGMVPAQLCAVNGCRVVHFMFHDRVAFGGVLIAIGMLYMWLTRFPLARGEEWAWWTLALSGAAGFGSFLSYLGYGYLDTWHAAATLALLPCFIFGMWRVHSLLPVPGLGFRSCMAPCEPLRWQSRRALGRIFLIVSALGTMGGGAVIMLVGMTRVFVPQDLEYLGIGRAGLDAINPHLIPLIAHDRAGFGGALLTAGLIVLLVVWKAPMNRALWQALLLSGTIGFGCVIGVHFCIGYLNVIHIAPAMAGAMIFAVGIFWTHPRQRTNALR